MAGLLAFSQKTSVWTSTAGYIAGLVQDLSDSYRIRACQANHSRFRKASTSLASLRSPVQLIRRGALRVINR